jgi:phospholipase A-2-activating protein
MQKKIEELNQKLISNGQKGSSLNPAELSVLQNVRKHLETTGATKASQTIEGGLDLGIKLITEWPYSDRLPGLDLIRLLAVAPMTATYTNSRGQNIVDILEGSVTENKPASENHVMMAIRGFVNLFDSPEGRSLALSSFDKMQSLTASALEESSNRNLLVAATTLYINFAVQFTSTSELSEAAGFEQALAIIEVLGKILDTQADSEVVYRALVAIGTLMEVGEEVRTAAKEVYNIDKSISTAVSKASDPRIRNVAKEIKQYL